MNIDFERQKRWYDEFGNLQSLMTQTQFAEPTFQQRVADALATAVSQYQDLLGTGEDNKVDAVLSLYKSSRRQRWYDELPQMYKALNLMKRMPLAATVHLDKNLQGMLNAAGIMINLVPPVAEEIPEFQELPNCEETIISYRQDEGLLVNGVLKTSKSERRKFWRPNPSELYR